MAQRSGTSSCPRFMVGSQEENLDRVRRDYKCILATCAIEKQIPQQNSGSTSLVGTGSLVRDFFPDCDRKVHLITSDKVISSDVDLTAYFLRFKTAADRDKTPRVRLSEVSNRVIIKSPGLAVIPVDPNKFSCIRRKYSGLLNHRPFTIEDIRRDGSGTSVLICYVVQTRGKSFSIEPYMVQGIADQQTYLEDLGGRRLNPASCFDGGNVWMGFGAPITMKKGEKTVAVGAITHVNNEELQYVLFSEIDRRGIVSDDAGTLQTVQADAPQGNVLSMSDDKTVQKEKEELAQRIKKDLFDVESEGESGIDSMEEGETDDDRDQAEVVPQQREKKLKTRSQRFQSRAKETKPDEASSEEVDDGGTNLSREIRVEMYPSKGSLKGGTQFVMVLQHAVPKGVISYQAEFEGCGVVTLSRKNKYTLEGVIPRSKHMGIKKVTLHFGTAKGSQTVGSTSFRYDDPEGLAQLVSDPETRLAFFGIMGMNEGNETAWSVKVLQLLVRTAVRIGCQAFIEIICRTEAAYTVLNSFKNHNSLPEDVARRNGFEKMANYIQITRERLSKEGDTKTKHVNWSEIRFAAVEHKQ